MQPGQRASRDLRRRLFGKRKYRTDIDLAQHIGVFAGRGARPIQEVRVPNDRQRRGVDIEQLHHLGRPFRLHPCPESLKGRCRRRMHDARTRSPGLRVRALGRRRNQRLHQLVPESDNLVGAHVAADHAVGQPRLERLIDDAAVGREIGLAAAHEIAERHVFGDTASRRLQHAHQRALGCGWRSEFDLPDALPAVAAVLLEDTRARRQPRRKLFAESPGGAIEMGVGAPAEALGAMKNLLHAHLEDHVGMSADPDPPGGDVAQHRVERRPVLAVGNRIDPDQHAVELQKLLPHLGHHIVGIDRRLGVNAERGQRLEDVAESVVVRRRVASRLSISAPKQRQSGGISCSQCGTSGRNKHRRF